AVINPVLALAPTHQLVIAEAAVSPNDDARVFAASPQGQNHFLQSRHDTIGLTVSGDAHLCPERDVAHKSVERQINVLIVVSVETSALLVAMKSMAHGIEIDDDFTGLLGQAPDSHFQEQRLNFLRIVGELMA